MKKRIGIVGHASGLALQVAIASILEDQQLIEIVSAPSKNYKGNPFDKPPIVVKPIPVLPDPIDYSKIYEEPKSKYINKPIRNYKR